MMAVAQGVPIADSKSIVQHVLEIAQMSYLTGGRELEADKKRRIDELHQDQLDALDATLAMMTGQTPWIGDLEVIPGAEAEVLYAVEDSNPYAARLFGDAKTSIEEMIVATAQKYAGHPGLARAGLNPVEFRIWFQSLVKQESGFSIGARSPVGAFGLTQVMPDTAKDLGIYPAYYDDPYLQVTGGARYLAMMLNMFDGNIIHALAAYNAGPGNVQNYGGVPPFAETQHYVVVIPQQYNSYLAAVGGIEGEGTPSGLDQLGVGLLESLRGHHRAVWLQLGAHLVADGVGRGDHLGDERARRLDGVVHGFRVQLGELLGFQQRG